ncbi:AurF N-oxygenase family protein [Marinactinospora thermotolerans]|uniref:p-aminobenzoate N-oxygenase AurF n=1 Tax=Marinactinospora thermotolerans DSM 45154 TaxID=1122192 RepID=A0A1T4RU42_9ACTN|nr:diiron oxygenase [Marinactinospora thermotolerans]SKA19417.1 P-aminobenzoate N-oxygenase AurF [Marinactinospora thermotolerans DSM 45154]
MTVQAQAPAPTDREDIAKRLLRSSAKASFDPLVEIDWDAPIDRDRYALRPERVSLYGTELWDRMTEEQRKELSRHEVASIASIGIWFETILMQMLVRHAYDRDPTSNHIQYAYTEIADECRHSVMFAKMVGRLGAPYYRLDPVTHFLGKVFKTISNGPLTFSGALFVEEILDQIQREAMTDESLEPLVRAVSRIHVVEEARHMRYAREEFIRDWPRRNALSRAYTRLVLGLVVYYSTTRLINPRCYAAVGLNPREARRVALRNPHWVDTRTWAARKVVATLSKAGAISGPGRYLWRKAGLLGRPGAPA